MSAIAVYCGSSIGNRPDFRYAAESLGSAMAKNNRPLVYGGGDRGIMGVVSGAVLKNKGKVTGVIPYALVAAGGEGSNVIKGSDGVVNLDEVDREEVETIIVDSMHERKTIMAQRAGAFIGLPGGFGTFEEVCEVTTWTILGIHNKPVVLLNVCAYWEPLRQMVKNAVDAGFIDQHNQDLMVFVDGPESLEEHGTFDWGTAALRAVDEWQARDNALFDWTRKQDGTKVEDTLTAT